MELLSFKKKCNSKDYATYSSISDHWSNKILIEDKQKRETATRGVLEKKKAFLQISQISQETPVLESLFNKTARTKSCNFITKTPA